MQNVFTLAICDFHSSEGVSEHTRDGTRERDGPGDSAGLNAPTESSPTTTSTMRILRKKKQIQHVQKICGVRHVVEGMDEAQLLQ